MDLAAVMDLMDVEMAEDGGDRLGEAARLAPVQDHLALEIGRGQPLAEGDELPIARPLRRLELRESRKGLVGDEDVIAPPLLHQRVDVIPVDGQDMAEG